MDNKNCENCKCGNCSKLTGLANDKDRESFTIAGCGIDGHITHTECDACENYKAYIKE